MDEADDSFRLFNCALCFQQVRLCRSCDRGNRYCGQVCAAVARRRSLAEAGRRYQRSFKGALKHAQRQATYQVRAAAKLTHQGFLKGVPSVILFLESDKRAAEPTTPEPKTETVERIRCSGCGVSCGPFARHDYIGRCRLVRLRGDRNDGFKRNRIRDPATLSC